MVKLVSEYYSNFYQAEFCSRASIICILMMCLAFLAPFYLSFTTDTFSLQCILITDFWLTLKSGYEHPKTSIIQLVFVKSAADTYFIQEAQMHHFQNKQLQNQLLVIIISFLIQIYPVWKDKKFGELNFERVDEYALEFTIKDFTKLKLELILEIDYEFSDVSKMKSRSQVFFTFEAPYYYDTVKFYGDLKLTQQYPLSYVSDNKKQYIKPYYADDFLYQDYMRTDSIYTNCKINFKYCK